MASSVSRYAPNSRYSARGEGLQAVPADVQAIADTLRTLDLSANELQALSLPASLPVLEELLLADNLLDAPTLQRLRPALPATLRVLDQIPAASDMARRGIGESTFSALHGGAHLKPHCGSTNCRLTCHLPLIVPPGDVSIRVGNETRQYREGEPMIFDDSYEHEVWHKGGADSGVRVVLLLRFWHPDLPPSEYGQVLREMRATYRRHQKAAMRPPL